MGKTTAVGLRDISRRTYIPARDVADVFRAILEALDAGERVMIAGFGVFHRTQVKATTRVMVAPDGEKEVVRMRGMYRVGFKPSKAANRFLRKGGRNARKEMS